MAPFDVLIPQVPDPDLGPLLTRLSECGYTPVVTSLATSEAGVSTPRAASDLPLEWREVRALDGQSYSWPRERETYVRYRVFAGETRSGVVHIALGEAERAETWGRDRKYLVAFLTSGAPQVPLVEFLEVDDYAESRELLAIVRGSDGGKKMYGPSDALPDVYAQNFRTEVYCDRIVYPRAWNKLAVIAREDDTATMLNHALLQARRRGDA